VIVTIDTLRADRLGCYGNRGVATPHIDGLARDGAMALHAAVQIPMTRPSHICLFTGLLPFEHGIRDNVSPALAKDVPTLAETLKAAGFETAAFVSSIVLEAQSGLDRGFDTYDDEFEGAGNDDAGFLNTIQKRGDETVEEAVAWLEAHHTARVFVWVHLFDPHDPYEPPEPYATRYAGRPYDGEVAWSDELVGRLDAAFTRLGLRDDTALLVTSDHGEGLGEHGEPLHGFFVYQSTLAVPFLVRGPGIVPGGRVPVTVRTTDIFPTVLDLLGVAKPPGLHFSGRSLADVLRGGPAPPEAASYAESLTPLLHFGWSDLRSLQDGRWKYIQAPRPELYDLETDPGETHNLASRRETRAETLRGALGELLVRERTTEQQGTDTVPPELLAKLGALGYLGTGRPAAGKDVGADPKDKIAEFKVANNLVRDGLLRFQEKDYAGSLERFRKLLDLGTESFEAHYYLGRGLVALHRYTEAARSYEAAVRYQPAYWPAYDSLAQARALAGDRRGALEALHQGQKAAPDEAALYEREGQIRLQAGQRREAIAAYETARRLAPAAALLRIRLGELSRDEGDLDRAAAVMREALAIDAKPASYWNSLGMVLGAKDDLAEAEKSFREATGRDPGSALYAYNLGLALQRQGRAAEASRAYRHALELDPHFGDIRARLAELGAGEPSGGR
jgi:arylsulfatase A-like enzyme/tetratricopeptide (TPR) repeat protein